jgi:hydrogenase-4 component B
MGMLSASAGMKIFMGMLAAILALTGGLAAACFVKAFGITFLAMPRSKDAAEAREAPFSMKLAMAFLSFLAIGFGVGASFILKILIGVSSNVMSVPANPENFVISNFIVSPKQDAGIFLSTPMTALAILAFMGIAVFAFYVISGRAKVKAHKTWDCGYYKLDQRTEYTATGFSKPFRIAFDFFLLPYRKTEKIRESFYHIKSFKYETHTTYVFKRFIYEPLLSLVFRTATVLRRMQPGSIHLYISYIFITILVLIMFMNRF